MENETILVEGMHCSKCSGAIEATLEDLVGISAVEADHDAGTVDVVYDPAAISMATIREAIADLGFDVVG